MANIKITDLTAYTDAASTDVLPIVDVGADVTKKITIGNVVKAVPLGTAALPGLAFDGDTNTGIYSPGADQVAISTNGTGRLFVDASGRLGLGTSSPSSLLHLADAGNITVGTTTGTKIGTATTQKLGFYNKTPVVQPTAIADATNGASTQDRLNDLLAAMRTLGLIAT